MVSESNAKVTKQLEFYFSDANLIRDKFMQKLLSTSEYVPLDTFMKFKRISEMVKSVDEIKQSLKEYPSTLLELDEEQMRIKRVEAFDKDAYSSEGCVGRLSNVPKDVSLHELLEYLQSVDSTIVFVQLIKRKNEFTGQAKVQFASAKDLQRAKSELKLEYKGQQMTLDNSKDDDKCKKRVEEVEKEDDYAKATVVKYSTGVEATELEWRDLKREILAKDYKNVHVEAKSACEGYVCFASGIEFEEFAMDKVVKKDGSEIEIKFVLVEDGDERDGVIENVKTQIRESKKRKSSSLDGKKGKQKRFRK